MNKEENMEIRTLETFIKGVKEEGASEPCKYVQFNKQEAQRLLDYVVELQKRIDKQERIDKAIEYLEKHKEPLHHSFDEPDCDYWIATNPDDLLDILRGEE